MTQTAAIALCPVGKRPLCSFRDYIGLDKHGNLCCLKKKQTTKKFKKILATMTITKQVEVIKELTRLYRFARIHEEKSGDPHYPPYRDTSIDECMKIHGVQLREHQDRVVRHFHEMSRHKTQKGIVLYHSVGSGKTITAITTVSCLLKMYPQCRTVIITPVSVKKQFENSIFSKILSPEIAPRINLISHETFHRDIIKSKNKEKLLLNTILVVDEVHKYKNFKSKKCQELMIAAKSAKQIVLLTATPIENNPIEIIPYMCMINGNSYRKEAKLFRNSLPKAFKPHVFSTPNDRQNLLKTIPPIISGGISLDEINFATKICKTPSTIRSYDQRMYSFSTAKNKITRKEMTRIDKYLQCKFSYFRTPKGSVFFPVVREWTVEIPMSASFRKSYEILESKQLTNEIKTLFGKTDNLAVFSNGLRRAVNQFTEKSPKVDWILDHVKYRVGQLDQKVLIYSQFLEFGVTSVLNTLNENGFTCRMLSGKNTAIERLKIVDDFRAGRYKVILITQAGAEGIDLNEIRSVIIMEPFWHYSKMEQVIGRAARYKSHANLPPHDRFVDVYFLLATKKTKREVKQEIADLVRASFRNEALYQQGNGSSDDEAFIPGPEDSDSARYDESTSEDEAIYRDKPTSTISDQDLMRYKATALQRRHAIKPIDSSDEPILLGKRTQATQIEKENIMTAVITQPPLFKSKKEYQKTAKGRTGILSIDLLMFRAMKIKRNLIMNYENLIIRNSIENKGTEFCSQNIR